jgi:hypothetical protein
MASFKYEPSEANANLIPDKTECDFQIKSAEVGTSKKSGKSMIVLTLSVWTSDGQEFEFQDWITRPHGIGKLKTLCACGKIPFDNGNVDTDQLVGVTGRCVIRISKDQSGQYPDKNTIGWYLATMTAETKVPVMEAAMAMSKAAPVKNDDTPPLKDDDIPF